MKINKMKGILPPWMEKWNFLKVLILSGIVFGGGFVCGFITPPLFKTFVKSVSKIKNKLDAQAHKFETYFTFFF